MAHFIRSVAVTEKSIAKSSTLQSRLMLNNTGGGSLPRLNNAELLAGYSKFPWLRAVINKISEIMASVEWHLEDGSSEFITDHPALLPLSQGNDIFIGVTLRSMMAKYLCIVGESLFWKERDQLGRVAALWPIPIHWVRQSAWQNNGVYEVYVNGRTLEIPFKDMLRIYEPDLSNPYGWGTGMGSTLADELETDEYAAKHLKAFFKNSARPDLLISSDDPDNPITPEGAERMERKWLQKLAGFARAHRPFFMPGRVHIEQLGSSLKDMQMIELRQFQRDVILQSYGLPPEALGILDNSNRSTIDSAQYFLTKMVAVPKLDVIRNTLQIGLINEFNPDLTLQYVSPVQEDKEHVLSVFRVAPWAFTVNEVRELGGRASLDGDDGDVYVLPLNMIFSDKPGGGVGMMGTGGDNADQSGDGKGDDASTGDSGKFMKAFAGVSKTITTADSKWALLEEAMQEAMLECGKRVYSGLGKDPNKYADSPRLQHGMKRWSIDLHDALQGLSKQVCTTLASEAAAEHTVRQAIHSVIELSGQDLVRKLARNAASRCVGISVCDAFSTLGVEEKQLHSVSACAAHAPALGEGSIALDDNFITGEAYPNDVRSVNSVDLSCRCAIVAAGAWEKDVKRSALWYTALVIRLSNDFEPLIREALDDGNKIFSDNLIKLVAT